MSLHESADAATIRPLPDQLETATGKLVYLAIDRAGESTVDELRDRLDLQKLVLFETLQTLDRRGLVARGDRGWTTR